MGGRCTTLSRTAGEGAERREACEGAGVKLDPHPPIPLRWVPPLPQCGRGFLLFALSICSVLAGCVPQYGVAPLSGDLRGARLACNAEYPRRIGNYLPHAICVNAAI